MMRLKRFPDPHAAVQWNQARKAKVDQLMALCDELETRQRYERGLCAHNNAAIHAPHHPQTKRLQQTLAKHLR